MIVRPQTLLALSIALAWSGAHAQEGSEVSITPAAIPAEQETPVVNEDEMADFLNSQQQIKQGVTLTKSVDGKVIETKKETITYTKDDPVRGTEASLSPIDRLKAEFDSETLTRKEALEEAKLDFVVADLDRSEAVTADEFVFLVKGWQDAEISGAGRGRFVDPYFHVDQEAADLEHAEQARAKFSMMADETGALGKKAFTRRIIEEFEEHDLDNDELLNGDELLSFRASVRGEPVDPR